MNCKYNEGCDMLKHVIRNPRDCTKATYSNCHLARFYDKFPEEYERQLEIKEEESERFNESMKNIGTLTKYDIERLK